MKSMVKKLPEESGKEIVRGIGDIMADYATSNSNEKIALIKVQREHLVKKDNVQKKNKRFQKVKRDELLIKKQKKSLDEIKNENQNQIKQH